MTGLLLSACLLAATPGDAWPAFRGDGTSITAARDLPLKWSPTENVAWKVDLAGYGQSSPVVWKGMVVATSATGKEKDELHVAAHRLGDGKELWHAKFPAADRVEATDYVSKSAPTPAVDAERVYALFETGDLRAFDHEGQPLWQRVVTRDYGKIVGAHGMGSSLALTETAVLVLVDHGGPSYLLAVDKKTGETKWKTDRDQGTSWSSPIVHRRDGVERILVSGGGAVAEYDAAAGKRTWFVEGLNGNLVPSPTPSGDLVVVGATLPASNVAIRLGGKDDVSETHVAWRSAEGASSFGSPLVHAGHVYLVNRTGVATCADLATGKTVWTVRLSASCWASPLGAGERVYFFATDGSTQVVRTGPEKKVLAENRIDVSDRVYGVAAIDGAFVVRTERALVRLGKPTAVP
jgi:outer membrane protein assembly factor BamB